MKSKIIIKRILKISFFALIVNLTVSPAFADLSMAGAVLPYSTDWYRNPALQNKELPLHVFTTSTAIPLGLMMILNPATFPYELLEGEINPDLDVDLLSMYIQLSNPFLMITNPPESPGEVSFNISQQKIQIQDDLGNPIPIESIPGKGAFSVSGTPLIPPPVFSLQTGWDNVFIGLGVFGGTSGISFIYDDNFKAMLSQMEIEPGDSTSIKAEFSSRAGLFEYINIISEPVYLFNDLEIEFAGRLLLYQILAELNASASIDLEIVEDYILSEFESKIDLFYYYPGIGFGVGARLDFGSVLKFSNWTIGISILNALGMEYSDGLSLQDDIFVAVNNFYSPFKPYFFLHGSYFLRMNDALTFIPIIDLGYGKTLFTHAALAVFWKNLSFKIGFAYEDRIKTALGAGIKIGCFSIESGVVMQQSVFDKMLIGLFIAMGSDS